MTWNAPLAFFTTSFFAAGLPPASKLPLIAAATGLLLRIAGLSEEASEILLTGGEIESESFICLDGGDVDNG